MFRWKRLAAVAAVVGLGLTGCAGTGGTGSTGGASGGTGGGALVLGALAAPSSYQASEVQWANQSPFMQAVYDTLLHASPEDHSPVPWLATEWTYNDDKTELTLTLRDDVTFTDGEKFNADAAKQNLDRFKAGTAPDASRLARVESVEAPDDTTLVIKLTEPDPSLLVSLAQAPGLVESPAAFENPDVKTVPVGSGPYVLDKAKTVNGSKYVYTKNADYFAPEQQYFDSLTINVLSTAQTQVNAIRGGQVDGLNIIDPTTIKQIEGAGYQVEQQELDWAGIALLDRAGKDTPALKEVKVRQAINYAVDRAAVLKAAAADQGTVTSSVFGTYSIGYDQTLDSYYTYDPEKAKSLLAEAGYESFTLTMPRVAGFGDVANNLIQKYLGEVGITVEYTTVPIANVIADVLAPKYSASYFTLQEDVDAFQASTFLLTKGATFNPYKVEDATIEELTKTIQTADEAEATAAAKELNKYVVENAIHAPFYRQANSFGFAADLTAVPQAGNAYPYLYNIKPKG